MSRNHRTALTALALVGGVVGGGGLAPARASEPTLNEWCPVMTEEEADPEITVEYAGKTVAFCCSICLNKFTNDPEKYLARLPQFGGGVGPVASAGHADETSDHHSEAPGRASEGSPQHSHGEQNAADEREPLLGRIHPVLVHFPVAGMPLALLGLAVWIRTGQRAFAKADVVPLMAATAASVAAVITGNIAHDHMRFNETLGQIVEQHQLLSTVVMVLALCLTVFRIWRWNRLSGNWRWVYGGGLCLACGLLVVTGYLGGSLVFGPEHLKW